MTVRSVNAGAGVDWLKRGFDLGRNNPKAIFGGAVLLLVAVLALAIAGSMLMAMLATLLKPTGTAALLMSVLFGGAVMALMAALIVGYLRLLDAVENGRPASATLVFSGFGDKAAALRAVGFMLVLMVAQNLLVFGLVAALAPEFGSWYLQNLQSSMAGVAQAPPTSLPAGFGTVMVLMWIVGTFCYAVQAIGLGQIALRARGVGAALSDGVSGAAKNLLPLLVLFLVVLVAVIVLVIAIMLLALVAGLLAKLVGAWLLVLVGIPLYIGFLVAMLVVMFGVMYYLWRDVCDDGMAPGADEGDAFEA